MSFKKKQTDEFFEHLVKLSPAEIYGLAKIMSVNFFEDKELKAGEVLILDILDKFLELNRKQRKRVITLLREVSQDGFSTENKEEE
jgi:hypothetical protein